MKYPGRFDSEPGLAFHYGAEIRVCNADSISASLFRLLGSLAVGLVVRSGRMIRPAQPRSRILRAACATLFLLFASVSAPLVLAAQSDDACGMACCVKEGHCCCNPHHASVKGQASDFGARISEPELTTSCPEGCAIALRIASPLSRDYLRTDLQHSFDPGPSPIPRELIVLARDSVQSGSFSPRAPPASPSF